MENFIVSARKYRPVTFESVVGQGHITSTLRNAILRGQLAHAYLFCGPRGVGKTTCARIFAKAINCLHPTAEAEACNECESCKAFNEGRSFTIHELDAASNNSVDDIRTLTDQVRIPPQLGRYSVYIIDEVHMLSLQAFNAFLKTLEEPPAHAIFILATTEKHKIIPTILSRCQIYDFNRIRVEDAVHYLEYIAKNESVTHDDESLHIIAQKADGGMRDALSMFDKVVSFSGASLTAQRVAETLNVLDYDTYFQVTQQIMAGSYTDALLLFDQVLSKGFSGATFVAGLSSHFRDLLICKNPQTVPLLEVTGSVAERYKQQSAETPVPLLFEGINLLTSIDGALRTSSNQRLHIELGLMKLCGLGQKKNSDTPTVALPTLVSASERGELAGVASSGASGSATLSGAVASVSGASVSSVSAGSAPAVASASVSAPIEASTSVASPVSTPSVATVSAPVSGMASSASAPASASASGSAPSASGASSSLSSSASSASASAPSLSGRSILSILPQTPPKPDQAQAKQGVVEQEVAVVEEDVEARLLAGCARYAEQLMSERRTRLANTFSEVRVSGNRVTLTLPNESLHAEVSDRLSDIKTQLGRISQVRSQIEFELRVEQSAKSMTPVKTEDRLRFLMEKNAQLGELIRALQLDIE